MNAIVEWISQPWPWYVAGPIIGLMVPLHLILLNRTFGISSSFRHVCAACIPNNLDFLKYDWKAESWTLVFAGGVLISAFLAASFFSSDAPIALSEGAVDSKVTSTVRGTGRTSSTSSNTTGSSNPAMVSPTPTWLYVPLAY